LACFALAAFLAFRLPVFFGADERSHFAYVVAIVRGDLPELTDRQPLDDRFPIVERSYTDRRPALSGVANHPPLAYVVAAPAVRLAAAAGSDVAPAVAMRLVNGAGMAAGVVVTGLFAAEAFPATPRAGRRRGPGRSGGPRRSGRYGGWGRSGRARLVPLGAAGIAAVTPNVVGVAGYGHNDGVAFAIVATALWLSARLLRAGPSPRRLAAAMVLAPAALLTRASLAPAVALLAGAGALAVWRRRRDVAGGLVRAGATGLAIGAAAAAGAGWFLLRNQRLYGSPTADDFLLERYHRRSKGSLVEVLTGGDFFSHMIEGLYGSVHPFLFVAHPERVVLMLGALLVAGAVAWALRRALSRERGTGAAGDEAAAPNEAGGLGLGGWALIAGYCAAVVVATASFFSEGGSAHPRYFLALVPVASALLAKAISELPAPRLVLAGTVATLATVLWSQIARYHEVIDSPTHTHPFDGAPLPRVAQGAALAVAALAGLAFAVALVLDAVRAARSGRDAGPATGGHRDPLAQVAAHADRGGKGAGRGARRPALPPA